jgi:hypothetical protein
MPSPRRVHFLRKFTCSLRLRSGRRPYHFSWLGAGLPTGSGDPARQRSRQGSAQPTRGARRAPRRAHGLAAADEHRAAGSHHSAITDAGERFAESHSAFGSAQRAFRRAVAAGDVDEAGDCHARGKRALAGMIREHRTAGARHADRGDSIAALQRAWRDAGAALDSDSDSQLIQGPTGIGEDQGSRSADFRRRLQDLAVIELELRPY